MSFVPAPQQAGASSTATSNNASANVVASVTPTPDGASEWELTFKTRSYDVFWIEKNALMYKDGITKVSSLTIFTIVCC
jgi:ATP-dependent RNA helicase DDX60